MFLKKTLFGYSRLKIYKIEYDNEEDLKNGIIKLLTLLKKKRFIVQVFSKENINGLLRFYDKTENFNLGNFNYYILKDSSFLENINISMVRFMNIYSLDNEIFEQINLNQVIAKSSFIIEFDNYLEIINLKIDLNQDNIDVIQDFVK